MYSIKNYQYHFTKHNSPVSWKTAKSAVAIPKNMCFPVFLNISKKWITQLQNPRYIFLSATVTACFLTVDVKVTQSTAAHIIRYHYVNIIRKGVSSFIMLFALAMIFIQCYLLMGNRRQDCAIFIHSTYLS